MDDELLKTLQTVGTLMPETPQNKQTISFNYINEESYLNKPQITAGNDDHDIYPPIPGHSQSSSNNNEIIGNTLIPSTQFESPIPTPLSILSSYPNGNNLNNLQQTISKPINNNNNNNIQPGFNGNLAPFERKISKDNQSIADSQISKKSRVSSRREEIQQMKHHIVTVSSNSNLGHPLVSAMEKHNSQIMLDPGFDPQKHEITVGLGDEEDDDDEDSSNSGSSSINTADFLEIENRKTERELKKELEFLKAQPQIMNEKTDNDDDDDDDDEDDDFDENYLDDNEINNNHSRQVIRAQSTAQWTTKAVNELHEDMEKQFKDLLARESMRQQNTFMQYTPNNVNNFGQQQPPLYLPIMEEATFSQKDNKSIHSSNFN